MVKMEDATNFSSDSTFRDTQPINNSTGETQSTQGAGSLRIETTLPSLPKFVVVGDQSHGKSSIIEAICDVTLPRAEGTCTRCPFRITTTAAADAGGWSCKITLLQRYKHVRNNKRRSGPKSLYSTYGWEDTEEQKSIDFATVHDKTELGRALLLAQLAVVNPEQNALDILQANNLEIETTVKFSPNIISLEISAPDLPELSFFDLPGTINVDAEGDQRSVNFVEALVKSYLEDEQAQILVAVSADQDLNNSTALKFVQAGAAAERSMGVLTKPDLITQTRARQIYPVLGGKLFKLGNGWFSTKHLSQDDLDAGVTYSEAREAEKMFFEAAPWGTDLAAFSERFGTRRLQDAISNKLMEHILHSLPEITARVENELQHANVELQGFPEAAKAPSQTVAQEIGELSQCIIDQLRGKSLVNEFRHAHRQLIGELSMQLKAARPEVNFTTPGYVPQPIQVDSDDTDNNDDEPVRTPAAKARKSNKGNTMSTPSNSQTGTPRARKKPITKPAEQMAAFSKKTVFQLDEVKVLHEKGRTYGLLEKNPEVTHHLTKECLKTWPEMVKSTLDAVHSLVAKLIGDCIHDVLTTRQNTELFSEVTRILEDLCTGLMAKQQEFLQQHLICEVNNPGTCQRAALQERVDTVKVTLRAKRLEARGQEYFDTVAAQRGRVTSDEERKKKLANTEWVKTTLPADKFEDEIASLARPIAYYDMTAATLPDIVTKHLEFGLMHGLAETIPMRLTQGLQIGNEEYCASLLAEDQEREAQRHALIAKKEKLLEASDKLKRLTIDP